MRRWLKYIDSSYILRVHPGTRLTAWTMTQSGGRTLDLIPGEQIRPLSIVYPKRLSDSVSTYSHWSGKQYPQDYLEKEASGSLSKVRADLKSAFYNLHDLESTWGTEGHLHFLVLEPTKIVVPDQEISWEVRLKFVMFLANRTVVPGVVEKVAFPFESLYTPSFGTRSSYSLGDFSRNVFAPILRERTTGSP